MGFRTSKFMTGMKSKKALKTISVATLVGLAGLGATNSAQANETPITPTLGDDASYTLTETTDVSLDNVITKYVYDETNNTLTEKHYQVNLKQTEYGEGDGVINYSVLNQDVIFKYDSTRPSYSRTNVNYSQTVDIDGDFIGNVVPDSSSTPPWCSGGVLNNAGVINTLNANFINNVTLEGGGAGVHSRYGDFGDITGNFVGNKGGYSGQKHDGLDLNNWTYGGALYVYEASTIGDVKANFIANGLESNSTVFGGALYTDIDTFGNVIGDFINNYAVAEGKSAYGGAISNYGIMKDLTGNYIGNYSLGKYTHGGAIHNFDTIGNITGDFIGNHSISPDAGSQGGAIWNTGTIGNITGDFIGNYGTSYDVTVSSETVSGGGALYNMGKVGIIQADFINNHYETEKGFVVGGAIANLGVANSIYPEGTITYGVYKVVDNKGELVKALYTPLDSTTGNQISKEEYIALLESGSINNLESPIIFSISEATIEGFGMTLEDFMQNALGNGFIEENPSEIFEQYVPIENRLPVTIDSVRNATASLMLLNSNIIGNYVISKDSAALGGAVYAGGTFKYIANDGEIKLIAGNYTKSSDVVDDNAIYMEGGKLIFDVTNGSTVLVEDNINGFEYSTFIIGDDKSKFLLNNKIKNSTTYLMETNLYLNDDSNLDGNKLNLHSGQLSMINNQVGVSALNRLTITGDTNVLVDVDLANNTMDRFTASEYGSHSGNLNVTGMNLLSDAVNDTTEILFAEQGLKDNVTNGIVGELPNNKYQTVAYTPIYKYNVSYDNREDAGYFVFSRPTTGGSTGGAPSVDTFNPAILGSSTSATVGATATMNQAFNYAFQNSADYMNIPYLERISMRDRNKYALSITGDATDMGRFSPLYQPSQEEASVWVKPYATFETVGLKNGPKVHNNTYGTLIGFDTEMQSIKRGWDRVFTGYIGYNGASQRYSGIDSTQNGGLLGGTMTLYKGNFFNATTVSVGASVANNQTMYGNEDFAMLLSGIGNKTGYNFEFKEGKLILQPSMLMSYTFVNTFDYTNAAGVRIDNKPLHALQLAPGVKVIGNLKNGWQPYASVQMVWNLMGESNATANGVKLPEMSIKPYVQYGVGVQKRIKDHFTAYGQAMVQNGGRNGVSLTAGFRWALGHDNCKYKVEDKQLRGKAAKQLRSDAAKQLRSDAAKQLRGNADKQLKSDASKIKRHYEEHSDVVISSNNAIATPSARNDNGRKILKQMTPQQRAAYGGKYYNTTRTAKAGSLRQY